jgi:hypothetical protein
MIATAFKFLNVTSRSARHRCVRSMSTTTTEVNDSIFILENKNPHEMDARISSCPEKKTFFFDGVELVHDIPLIVEEAFPKFDPDEAVKRMMLGSAWPRQPYIKKDGTPYTVSSIL